MSVHDNPFRQASKPDDSLGDHSVMRRAEGILMALNYTDADAAWAALQRVSADRGVEMRVLAEATIAIATTPNPTVELPVAAAVQELLWPSLLRSLGGPAQ